MQKKELAQYIKEELVKDEVEIYLDIEDYKVIVKALEQETLKDMGEVSDGYHTFNQLYYQRAVLFATIVNQNKDKSWKSFKHFDGKYCFDSDGEWFIVGIDTPKGSYTYHYAKEYWDMFDCKELECGKEWDGHTEEDVTRLLSLEQEPCEDAVSRDAFITRYKEWMRSERGKIPNDDTLAIRVIKSLPSVTPKPKTDVLDKIRAEIEQNAYPIVHGVNNHEKGMTLYGILQVIDKYKAESEE